jgi:uncharacterized DUF497 family protein
MKGELFEWDDAKAEENEAKHGVAFEEACGVFDDLNWIVKDDDTHAGEDRVNILGMVGLDLLHVTAAPLPAGRYRIISARKATRHERRRYAEEAQP